MEYNASHLYAYPLCLTQAQDLDRIDVGWVSVWAKITAQWVTSLLYCWTLIAPTIFPDRDFS